MIVGHDVIFRGAGGRFYRTSTQDAVGSTRLTGLSRLSGFTPYPDGRIRLQGLRLEEPARCRWAMGFDKRNERRIGNTDVRASPGKIVRVEPVAALYDQGRVHHIGTFPQLEDQMTNFTSDIDRAAAGYSPDRVDALVWAF